MAYIAVDPTFPHHLNSFDNVPINDTAGDVVSLILISGQHNPAGKLPDLLRQLHKLHSSSIRHDFHEIYPTLLSQLHRHLYDLTMDQRSRLTSTTSCLSIGRQLLTLSLEYHIVPENSCD